MITQHGPQCDVCGDYIFPMEGEMVNLFTVKGVSGTLCCHNKCRPVVERGKWEDLPSGPLRRAWESSLA